LQGEATEFWKKRTLSGGAAGEGIQKNRGAGSDDYIEARRDLGIERKKDFIPEGEGVEKAPKDI